jgi:NAD(P)H-dependent FMN reductase
MSDPTGEALAHPPLRVLVFAASLRANSLNSKLARLAARHVEEYGATADLAAMRDFDVPSFDADIETGDGVPGGASELNRRLTECDAFIIASPEYNASMPGVLKNLIDWASRFRPQPFHERHGLVMSASPSMAGGNRGLWALRVPLEHLGARVFPDMFSLAMAHKGFEGDRLTDPKLAERFQLNVRSFLELAEAAKHYPCVKRAWIEFLGEPGIPSEPVIRTGSSGTSGSS